MSSPSNDPAERTCPFPKHEGKQWWRVVEEDPRYAEWLVSGEGPDLPQIDIDAIVDCLEES